jgi:hypothetical protein
VVQRSSLQNCKAIGSNPIPHSKVMGVLQLWRVLHRTVNPVPRGKHSRFESVDTHQDYSPLAQLVVASDC